LPSPTATKTRTADIQESLKILQFRFGLRVGFRPVVVGRGVRCYPVDGKLRAESEIVSWSEIVPQPKEPAID
jgi:hypothetical protein